MQQKEKKYTIAVMTGSIQSDYVLEMMRGFHTAGRDYNVHVVMFLGPQIPLESRKLMDERITENYNDYFSVVYQYTHLIRPDAVVMSYGSLSALLGEDRSKKLLKMFRGIPYLVLEDEFVGGAMPSVTADNYSGMKQCVNHLIEEHGFKKIVFLSGPRDNYDANERLKAYLDVMKEHQIFVTEGMVAYGSFSRYEDEQVLNLIKKNPGVEAIVCADDLMAVSCYRVCESLNLTVGKDIAVTGFDNSSIASTMNPPLTSVSQNVFDMGYGAIAKAVALCKGERVSSDRMQTSLRRRASCSCRPLGILEGCSIPQEKMEGFVDDVLRELCPSVFESIDHAPEGKMLLEVISEYCYYLYNTVIQEDGTSFRMKHLMVIFKRILKIPFFFKNQFLEGLIRFLQIIRDNAPSPRSYELMADVILATDKEISRYNIDAMQQRVQMTKTRTWFLPLFISSLIQALYYENPREIFFKIMNGMKKIDIQKAYFLLFDQPVVCEMRELIMLPEEMYLVAHFSENDMRFLGKTKESKITVENGFTSFIKETERMELSMAVLFSDNRQYGVLLCEVACEDIEFLQICGIHLGSVLHFMELNQTEQKAQQDLQISLQVIREQNKILSFLSEYDELTKLLNRRGFIEQALSLYMLSEGKNGYLIFGDLDHLKEINDEFGHAEGDYAIISAAKRFREILPESAVIGRIGGDEFVAFIVSEEQDYERKLRLDFTESSRTFNENCDKPYFVEISIGIHRFICDPSSDFDMKLKQSDRLLYEAKTHRRKSIQKKNN